MLDSVNGNWLHFGPVTRIHLNPVRNHISRGWSVPLDKFRDPRLYGAKGRDYRTLELSNKLLVWYHL